MVGVGFRPICDGKMNVNYVKKKREQRATKEWQSSVLLLYAFMMLLTLALLHESSSHLRYFMRCWSSSKVSHEFQIRFLSISRQRSSRDKKNLQCRYFSHTKKKKIIISDVDKCSKSVLGEREEANSNKLCMHNCLRDTPAKFAGDLSKTIEKLSPCLAHNFSKRVQSSLSLCLRAVIYDKTDLFRGGSRRKAMNGEAERENQHI